MFDNSDAETIPYTEPYKNTFTKKDEIYRRNAKKKALKILRNKRKRVDPLPDAETIPYAEPYVDPLSVAETIPYVEPYKVKTSKRDKLYREKAKERAIKAISRARKARAKETARLEKEAIDFLINNRLKESTEAAFSKRDNIYKQNAKKRAIKTIAKARQSRKRKADKEVVDLEQRAIKFLRGTPDTGMSRIPYRTSLTKRDNLYRKKAKKKAVKYLMRLQKRKRK